MKTLIFSLMLVLAALLWIRERQHLTSGPGQTVNALLGDTSFEDKFGSRPTDATDEDLRISTHLEYVEKLLREADVSALSDRLKAKRRLMLDLLREYRTAGVFPRNYDHGDERKPCFIDRDGKICAVGYLIERTAGREIAEAINQKYQYEEILAMNDPVVDGWIAGSGLTKTECALIQPTYGGPTVVYDNKNHVSKGYSISSAMLGGVNLSLAAINAIQIGKEADGRIAPWLGVVTGAAQIALGIAEYPDDEMNTFGEPFTNVGQRNVSFFNIGLGTATMVLSSWNLLTDKPKKEKSVRWGFQGMTVPGGQEGIGFSVMKRF